MAVGHSSSPYRLSLSAPFPRMPSTGIRRLAPVSPVSSRVRRRIVRHMSPSPCCPVRRDKPPVSLHQRIRNSLSSQGQCPFLSRDSLSRGCCRSTPVSPDSTRGAGMPEPEVYALLSLRESCSSRPCLLSAASRPATEGRRPSLLCRSQPSVLPTPSHGPCRRVRVRTSLYMPGCVPWRSRADRDGLSHSVLAHS